MELIIGLIALGVVGYFVFFRTKDEPLTPAAPYKVETQVSTPEPAPVPEVKVEEPQVVVVSETVAVSAPAAKAPRKPRAPKAEKPAARSVVKSKKA